MQQRTRRLAIVFGGSLLVTLGFLAACSTDNGTTPLPGTSGTDSGRDTGKKPGEDGSVDPDDDGGTKPNDSGTTADCSTAPRLRSNTNGFFCAFFSRDGGADAGGNRNCANDEICCNPGPKTPGGNDFPKSFCANKTAATNECATQAVAQGSEWVQARSTTWECADKNACADGESCCMYTWADAGPTDKVNIGVNQDQDIPKACNALQAYKVGGSRCASACNADEIKLCSLTDDNCTGNQKCTPFEGVFRDLGYCK